MEKPIKLMELLITSLSQQGYSESLTQKYCTWIRYFIVANKGKPVFHLSKLDISLFLRGLEVNAFISPEEIKEAQQALNFFHREIVNYQAKKNITDPFDKKIPTLYLKPKNISLILSQLKNQYLLIANLLYGMGITLKECLQLRLEDIDLGKGLARVSGDVFEPREIEIPESVISPLSEQIKRVKNYFHEDQKRISLVQGDKRLNCGDTLAEEVGLLSDYHLFCCSKAAISLETGHYQRYPIQSESFEKALSQAVVQSGLTQSLSSICFRHSSAVHSLRRGMDIFTLKDFMGHKKLSQTHRYLSLLKQGRFASTLEHSQINLNPEYNNKLIPAANSA